MEDQLLVGGYSKKYFGGSLGSNAEQITLALKQRGETTQKIGVLNGFLDDLDILETEVSSRLGTETNKTSLSEGQLEALQVKFAIYGSEINIQNAFREWEEEGPQWKAFFTEFRSKLKAEKKTCGYNRTNYRKIMDKIEQTNGFN